MPSCFIQQKLHTNRAKVFEHLQCEAHRTISAVELQHGSSHTKTLLAQPHGLPHQKPHPNRPRMLRHLQCEAHRSRSAVEVQAISPTSASSKRSFTQIRHKCSSSFNAKITRPAGSFSFSKPTGPYRAFTDRSSFSGPSPYSVPTVPPFKDLYGQNSIELSKQMPLPTYPI